MVYMIVKALLSGVIIMRYAAETVVFHDKTHLSVLPAAICRALTLAFGPKLSIPSNARFWRKADIGLLGDE